MVKEFTELMKDYVQDTRVYSNVEYKFETIIDLILSNTDLNYSKTDLRIKSDVGIISLIRIFAEKKYKERFNTLYKEEIESANESEEIPF